MILAFCGNDCALCPRYTATRSGDEERPKEVPALWKRAGYREVEVSPQEIACQGCPASTWCRYEIRECALDKGVKSCGECQEYPCQRITNALEKTEAFTVKIKKECSRGDYDLLRKAFFEKKKNLDRVHDAVWPNP